MNESASIALGDIDAPVELMNCAHAVLKFETAWST
jgi:hypothetical protein